MKTVKLKNPPVIIGSATIAGKNEGEGPIREYFDEILKDDRLDCKSWEQAESKLQRRTGLKALSKTGLKTADIDYLFAGDLMNQCAATHYGVRDFNIPFFGLYGACSTMTESLALGAMTVSAGYADKVMCMTSSHFCASERQFRNPLNYGGQRPPSAQWTVTGAGCAILSAKGNGVKITHATVGRIVDNGITDANNMGAAMAPATADTLIRHFKNTGARPGDYDLILTGDLGIIGSEILCEALAAEGYDISNKHDDCGKIIYDIEKQDKHSGASGCGCCATVFCGYIMEKLKRGELGRILLTATGALMNTSLLQQGESIPAIAHTVEINGRNEC